MRRHPGRLGSLSDGTVFYAPLGEMLRDGEDRVCCHLCGRWMKAVGGTHLRWHGWTIDDYREAFQLGRQTRTCAPGVSESFGGQQCGTSAMAISLSHRRGPP